MKNIHVLPTDKPTIIFKSEIEPFLHLYNYDARYFLTGQNIHITSDEKIKEGDWYFDGTDLVHKKTKHNDALVDGNKNSKKIILTTDQDLIKDGVQAIDDDFLEWFVKNPSCEEVYVKDIRTIPALQLGSPNGHLMYEIIIPKEEPKLKNICIKCGVDLYATEGRFECQKHPKECKGIILPKETLQEWADKEEQKQHLIDMMKADEELELYEEPKQETLEEVAERIYLSYENNDVLYGHSEELQLAYKAGIVDGAKWQAERMYSEEDLESAWNSSEQNMRFKFSSSAYRNISFKKWLENFKKK